MNYERKEKMRQIDDHKYVNHNDSIERRKNIHKKIRLQKKIQRRRYRQKIQN